MDTGKVSDEQKNFAVSFEKIVVEIYSLLDACSSRVLLASSTVNPRHPLPNDHAKLIAFETEGKDYQSYPQAGFGKKLKRFIISLLFAARETLHILYVRLVHASRIRSLYKEKVQIVIKTWYFYAKKEAVSNFYYGNLAPLLEQEGIQTMIVGGNLGKSSIMHFSNGMLAPHRRSVPEKALLPFWAPGKVLIDQLRTYWQLRKLVVKNRNSLFSTVATEAAFECLSLNTLANALHYYIAKRAVEKWHPKAYATLYEGQPWEKLAWLGVKTASKECLTIGYQHTIIMSYSWGLIKPSAGSAGFTTPDVVLTLGNIPQKLMEDGQVGFNTKFITLGSFRRKAETGAESIKYPQPSQQKVLVVPEGFLSEATILFDRAAQLAVLLPDHHFIFRSHPFLPFKNVQPFLSVNISSILNIELSTNVAIEDDFARASCLLYRGSSVVLYGILNGLKPWYLNEPGLAFVDPLFALTTWRETAGSVSELAASMKEYSLSDAVSANNEWLPAKTYVEEYSKPIQEAAIQELASVLN